MKVPASLALLSFVFWNKHAFSLKSEAPLAFLTRQTIGRIPKLPTNVDLTGQTVLITGGNAGLGLDAAKKFIHLGADIILAVRNVAKGEAAKEVLLEGKPGANVSVREVDMASFESIKNFCTKLEEDSPRVDVALLNAGLYEFDFEKSKHGYEMHLQVNTLGTILLSILLLPTLTRSSALRGSPTRLLSVTSESHAFSNFSHAPSSPPSIYTTETAADEIEYSPAQAYHLSKLLLMLLSRELAMRVDSTKVLVGEVTPGFTNSALFSDLGGVLPWIIQKTFGRTLDQGARLYVHAAVSTKDEEFHGGYWRSGVRAETSTYSRSEDGKAFGKELWKQTIELFNEETSGGLDLKSLTLADST